MNNDVLAILILGAFFGFSTVVNIYLSLLLGLLLFGIGMKIVCKLLS